MEYKELDDMCEETKMYAKRTMDLWCDSKKWHWLAEHSENQESKQKYMNISNTLYDLFINEINNMKL